LITNEINEREEIAGWKKGDSRRSYEAGARLQRGIALQGLTFVGSSVLTYQQLQRISRQRNGPIRSTAGGVHHS
jgi:hypothetical protein